jgi:hypothetical protein
MSGSLCQAAACAVAKHVTSGYTLHPFSSRVGGGEALLRPAGCIATQKAAAVMHRYCFTSKGCMLCYWLSVTLWCTSGDVAWSLALISGMEGSCTWRVSVRGFATAFVAADSIP